MHGTRHRPAPLQESVLEFLRQNPGATSLDVYKGLQSKRGLALTFDAIPDVVRKLERRGRITLVPRRTRLHSPLFVYGTEPESQAKQRAR